MPGSKLTCDRLSGSPHYLPTGAWLVAVLSYCAWGFGCAAFSGGSRPVPPQDFSEWRRDRERSLRSESEYLALAGLFWLSEGSHTFGSGADNAVVFPADRAPLHAGEFVVKARQVTLYSAPQVQITTDGQPVSRIRMISDTEPGGPAKFQLGDLTFWLIERGGRLGIRLSDPQSPILQNYKGTATFPYAPQWRLAAQFESFDVPRSIQVPTILGTSETRESSGRLQFSVNGVSYHLQPTGETETEYFVVFGDATNGRETYGGGRFLRVPKPTAGNDTIIDFNRAYNPPCAYSPYTTCPMPPPDNRLNLRIEAGEIIEGLEHSS